MQQIKGQRWRGILRRRPFSRKLLRSTRRLRRSRSRAARICSGAVLSIAWFLLLLLTPGCNRREEPHATDVQPGTGSAPSTSPRSAMPPASGRSIQFRGLDHDYQGQSQVQPNGEVTHQKETHD
jgi:hypothetical protein